MRSTIDMAGRLVVPKPIRDQLGLKAGTEVEIAARDGRIEIEPILGDFRVVRKGRFAVIQAPPGTPIMTNDQVNELIRQVRERKID